MSEELNDRADAELVARIAPVLRQPVQADGSFEERLMAAIRFQVSSARRRPAPGGHGWWRRDRSVRLSAMSGLAMAAGLAAVVALSSIGAYRLGIKGAGANRDTVHVVRFVFADRSARNVALVGDFNGWTRDSTPLVAGDDGVWSTTVPLRRGRHEYAFIVDGERWTADPLAPTISDEFDTPSSVVTVGSSSRGTDLIPTRQ